MKKLFQLFALLLPVTAFADHWTAVSNTAYDGETMLYVKVNINGTAATANDGLELAAFMNDECRAIGSFGTGSSTTSGNGVFTLRVRGKVATDPNELNQPITLRAYYNDIEYQFKTTYPFTGETPQAPSNAYVINLDAVTGISFPAELNYSKKELPFTTDDLSSQVTFLYGNAAGSTAGGTTSDGYTPLGESTILSKIAYEWYTSNQSQYVTFSENKAIITQFGTYPITLNAFFGEAAPTGGAPKTFTTTFNINMTKAVTSVTGISCSVEGTLEFNAYDDLKTYLTDKVTITPAEADDKDFTLEASSTSTTNFDGTKFYASGDYTVTIMPTDKSYTGTGATIQVKVYTRPTKISGESQSIEVGIGENVKPYIERYTKFTYPETDPNPTYKKEDVVYDYGTSGLVDAEGKATKEGTARIKVTLVNGITTTGTQTTSGSDFYYATVKIVSRLKITTAAGATDFVKNGSPATETPVYVYVENPGNEPFDATKLTITFKDRYKGFPYAEQTAVTAGTDASNKAAYLFTILPKFTGTQITYTVSYDGNAISTETQTGGYINITKEQPLANGWNWMSVTNMQTDNGTTIQSAFTKDDIVEIRSQKATVYNDPAWGYFGDLTNITPNDATYKVKTNKATVAKLGAISAIDKGMLAVNIQKGYNWINNPYEFDIPAARINEFLDGTADAGGMKPAEGDIIYTKTKGFATYNAESGWTASDGFALLEGEGLLYYCAGTNGASFNYNASLAPTNAANGVKAYRKARAAQEGVYQYDAHAFADNMAMIATVDGVENLEDYTLGVFVNGECRGRGRVVKDNIMFVNAVGKMGEKMTFKLHNDQTDEEFTLDDSMTYTLQKGSLNAPVVLSGSTVTGIQSARETETTDETIYDLQGRRVENAQKGLYIIGAKKVIKK